MARPKFAHQACLGSEHAAPDWANAERWLEREITQLGDGPQEPMLDPISADGRVLRVHQRGVGLGFDAGGRLADAGDREAALRVVVAVLVVTPHGLVSARTPQRPDGGVVA